MPHLHSSSIKLSLVPTFHFVCRLCHGGAWAWALLVLFISINTVYAEPGYTVKPPDVTIVVDAGSNSEFHHALAEILSSQKVSYQVIDATQPIPASGLIIGVGLKAATVVTASDAPSVLNVFITKATHNQLLQDFPQRTGSRSFSAIFIEQPIHRQVHLIKAIFPDKRNVGILYSTPSAELAELRQKLNSHKFVLNEERVDQTASLSEALQEILLGRSEMLLALPDGRIYNDSTIRNILLATYRRGIPSIGFSSSLVNAGALCAVFSAPRQIARQAAALIRQFGTTHELPAAQYPKEFEVLVNEHVALSLDLRVKSASVLHDEIVKEVEDIP